MEQSWLVTDAEKIITACIFVDAQGISGDGKMHQVVEVILQVKTNYNTPISPKNDTPAMLS